MLAGALLLVALAAAVGYVRPRWIGLPQPYLPTRRHRYRRLIVKDLVHFGGVTVVALALLGRVEALWVMPREFAAAAEAARALVGYRAPDPLIVAAMLGGILGGGLIGGLVARWRQRAPLVLGRIETLLPTDRGEITLAAIVALIAGVTEEMFFRLLVPLLLVLATGNLPLSLISAALLFGAVHRYQGWVGVVATTLVGALLSVVYLASAALWLAMAVHAAIDINGLVLRPALARRR